MAGVKRRRRLTRTSLGHFDHRLGAALHVSVVNVDKGPLVLKIRVSLNILLQNLLDNLLAGFGQTLGLLDIHNLRIIDDNMNIQLPSSWKQEEIFYSISLQEPLEIRINLKDWVVSNLGEIQLKREGQSLLGMIRNLDGGLGRKDGDNAILVFA